MYNFVNQYVKGCTTCQQDKPNTHPLRPPLAPIPAPDSNRPFAQVSVDFITDLPEGKNGEKALCVMVDHGLTKGVILTPCDKNIDAEGTAHIFIEKIFARFGLPDTVISDRGTQFTAKFFTELFQILGIEQRFSTAYHPQMDGQTEHVNQESETYFWIFCGNNPKEWPELCPITEYQHNIHTHSARNASPFHLMMGYEPKDIPTPFPKTNAPAVGECIQAL